MTKTMRRVLALLAVAVLCFGLLAGCGESAKKEETTGTNDNTTAAAPAASTEASSANTATVILVDENEEEFTLELTLEGEVSIREAMIQNKLVPEEEYAAMTFETIDGHSAKMEDGVLWMLCDAEGNQLMATVSFAIDDNTVKPGDTIKFVYTVAPYFDD